MSPAKRLFQTLALTLGATVLIFFGVGFLLADHWQVDTTRTVAAPPAKVEALLRDFELWQQWSQMKIDLGNQGSREVTGTPGAIGHRVLWKGAQGDTMLTFREFAPGKLSYDYHSRLPEAGEPLLVGQGSITWVADGDGTKVTWHDEGRFPHFLMRWIGWFGALQEQVRQIQSSSLAGLADAATKPAGK